MYRKFISFLIGLIIIPAAVGTASGAEPDSAGWQLINRDAQGNTLYMVSPAEQPENNIKRVWMKVETPAENSPSPMLFLNDIDCSQGLIKRLEVKLYSKAAGSEPFQTMSFDPKWDRPSVGLEQTLHKTVCRQENEKSL